MFGVETPESSTGEWTPAGLTDVSITRDDIAEISATPAEPGVVMPTERSGEHRPRRGEVLSIEMGTLFTAAIPEPAAAQPYVRPGDNTFIPPSLPGTVIFMRGYNPVEIIAQIKRRRVSVLVSVPKILDVLKEHVNGVRPGLKTHVQPAARRNVAWRWWRYRKIHRAFGMKFWSPVAAPRRSWLARNVLGPPRFRGDSGIRPGNGAHRHTTTRLHEGSVGGPSPASVLVAPDREILVRGDNVTKGYFNADEENARAFEDGWFHTGDIGEIGEDRQLIRGRKKEMIVTPG
jgi:hypothetical protein